MIGVDVSYTAKALLGLSYLTLCPVGVAEIVERGGVAGISRQSLLVRRNRVVESILCRINGHKAPRICILSPAIATTAGPNSAAPNLATFS